MKTSGKIKLAIAIPFFALFFFTSGQVSAQDQDAYGQLSTMDNTAAFDGGYGSTINTDVNTSDDVNVPDADSGTAVDASDSSDSSSDGDDGGDPQAIIRD